MYFVNSGPGEAYALWFGSWVVKVWEPLLYNSEKNMCLCVLLNKQKHEKSNSAGHRAVIYACQSKPSIQPEILLMEGKFNDGPLAHLLNGAKKKKKPQWQLGGRKLTGTPLKLESGVHS